MGGRSVGVGLLVVLVGALAWLFMRVQDPGSSAVATHRGAAGEPAPTTSGAGRPRAQASARPPARQDLSHPSPPGTAGGPGVPEYTTETGTRIRDHRAADKPVDLLAPVPVPRAVGKVEATTIAALRGAIRPQVHACIGQSTAEASGDRPMLQADLRVSIQDGRLSVDEVVTQLRDVSDPTLRACVSAAIRSVSIPAAGHADVERYPLTMPFRL